jgi:hypothetical protein
MGYIGMRAPHCWIISNVPISVADPSDNRYRKTDSLINYEFLQHPTDQQFEKRGELSVVA